MLCMIFGIGGGSVAFAEDKISTLTFTAKCSGSGTADDNVKWTVTSDAAESEFDTTKGIHYGTGQKAVSYLKLTTSDISGTVTKIVVNASGAKGTSAKLDVTVGGNAFGSQNSLTKTATSYTFSGNASGEIIVNLSQTSATKALYVKSISVTYSTGSTSTTVTFGAEVDDQTFNVNLGETFEGKTATVSPAEAGNVTYSSDKPEVASVDENGAITIGSKEGTATITASFAATETYQASSAKYYITVTDPNVPVFKKVTSNDDIVDGEQYLIICEDKNKAMSSYNNKYYNVVDVTVTDNTYEGKVNADGLPYTVTVHKSATDGYYTLETAEGYVKSTTSDNSSIYNSAMTSEEDVFLWKIDVTDSYSPIYSKYVSARFIAYNSDQSRIALYKSGTNASQRILVSLYKKVGSKPAEPTYGELTFKAHNNDGYYATFSSDKDVVFTSDVIVYAVSVADNKMTWKDLPSTENYAVTDATAGTVTGYYVPKNNGVLIYSTQTSAKYYFPMTEDGNVTIENNNLKAAPAAGGTFDAQEGFKYYKLAYDNYETKERLGFYLGEENGGAFSVKAGTAYLAVPTSKTTNVKGFSFDGTTTGISAVGAEGTAKTNEIYNIAGQRVNAMTKAGLYIVNGKKMVIKK